MFIYAYSTFIHSTTNSKHFLHFFLVCSLFPASILLVPGKSLLLLLP